MSPLQLLVVAHATATLGMAGVIWFVQIVHYPLLDRVPAAGFAAYHAGHTTRTGRVVVPLMLLELGMATALLLVAPREFLGLAWAGIVALAIIWLSTFLLQVPLHRRLAAHSGARARDVRDLVRTNWIRTVGWSLRAVLALSLVVRAVAQA